MIPFTLENVTLACKSLHRATSQAAKTEADTFLNQFLVIFPRNQKKLNLKPEFTRSLGNHQGSSAQPIGPWYHFYGGEHHVSKDQNGLHHPTIRLAKRARPIYSINRNPDPKKKLIFLMQTIGRYSEFKH